jgi:tRNA(Ile)-lysidine synthase
MVDAIVSIRNAVRPHLQELEPGEPFLVAVSGGADSLALAFALLLEAKPLALRPIAITIDHQLQEISQVQAEKVARQLSEMGYLDICIEKVQVVSRAGLEADAREARYQALHQKSQEEKACKVFLGHTSNDQAETVLLGLARGSGTRSLSGMAEENGIYIRPLLSLSREITERVCLENSLDFWNDPHNEDSKFSRVKIRREVIPYLEENLDPGISSALIRSASLLRDDGDALDLWAKTEISALDLDNLDCLYLATLPRAIRTRILRMAALAAGTTPGTLTFEQIGALDSLISRWSGQGEVSLSGGVKVARISGRLSLSVRHT